MQINNSTANLFEETSRGFLTWLQQDGSTISDKIELADLRYRSAGRGVVARESIEEDAELFSVPRKSILTKETSDIPTVISTEINDPWQSLILTMIYEHQQGDNSRWKPYLEVLPNLFNTLMFWSDSELEHLQGSAVLDKIGKTGADDMFKRSILPVIQKHTPQFGTLSDQEALSLCHQMGSTIMAYAFDLEPAESAMSGEQRNEEDGWEEDNYDEEATLPKGMVPLADMLNADADRNNAKLFYEEDKVVMRSIKPIAAGEEIFNDYGPLPRADVLRRYGYVTENYSKFDVVDISLDLVTLLAQNTLGLSEAQMQHRLEYLDGQGVLDDGFTLSRADCEELGIVLNTLTLSKVDFDNLRSKDKLPKPELSPDSLALFHIILVHRRAAYGTKSVDQDRMELHDLSKLGTDQCSLPTQRRRMAMQVIIGEKEILQDVFDSLQSRQSQNGKKRSATSLENEAVALSQTTKRTRDS